MGRRIVALFLLVFGALGCSEKDTTAVSGTDLPAGVTRAAKMPSGPLAPALLTQKAPPRR